MTTDIVALDNTSDDPRARAPLVIGADDDASITEKVCRIVEADKPPKAWYVAFAISATPAHRVLVVHGGEGPTTPLTETYFLEKALGLSEGESEFADSPFRPTVLPYAAGTGLPTLTDFDAVVLANVGGSLSVTGAAAIPGSGGTIQNMAGDGVSLTNVGSVALDLMVAPHQAGATSKSARAARIPPHEKMTARIAHGLEPALIDSTVETIAAFEPTDRRSFRLRVAGPAALLVAKAVKLGERLAQEDARPDRVSAKDALDAFRLLQTASAEELVAGFSLHATVAEASEASREALALYREHGVAANGRFPRLAASAAGDDAAIAPSFAALVNELLAALGS